MTSELGKKLSMRKWTLIEPLVIDEKHEHSWGCSSSRGSVSHLSFGVNIKAMFSLGKRYICLAELEEAQVLLLPKAI